MSATEYPIRFSGGEVRATLAGQKTQMRLPMKPQPYEVVPQVGKTPGLVRLRPTDPCLSTWKNASPFGVPGDWLWVQETWRCTGGGDWYGIVYRADTGQQYPAAYERMGLDGLGRLTVPNAQIPEWQRLVCETRTCTSWRRTNHMPRWASRITLKVVDVKIELVQDISVQDVVDEGVQWPVTPSGRPLLDISSKYSPSKYLPDGAIEKGTLRLKDEAAYVRAHFASLWDSMYAAKGLGWEANPWVSAATFRLIKCPEVVHEKTH